VIFGVAVVFPVITFGVAGVMARRHAQAPVQGFFPWSSASALMCAGEQHSLPSGGTLLVYLNCCVAETVESRPFVEKC